MKIVIAVILGLLAFTSAIRLHALPQGPPSSQITAGTVAKKNASRDGGEQRFRAHCGRCHNAPESLSPREVKAVLQHMRVRAMLSAEDEKLILKYLAP